MKNVTLNLFLLLLVTLVILPSAMGFDCYYYNAVYKRVEVAGCEDPNVCYNETRPDKSVDRGCTVGNFNQTLGCNVTTTGNQTICYCKMNGCNGDGRKGKSNMGGAGALMIPSLGTLLLISVPAFFLY